MYLNVQVALQVVRSPLRLEMTDATFTYQAGGSLDDPRPVFEYHYQRDSRSGYPRCHMHVHATPRHYSGDKPFSRLHLPTRRLTLEQIVWHLIQEHGVQPRRPDWHQVLWRHETHFRDTQRPKPWPYDPPFDSPAKSRPRTPIRGRYPTPDQPHPAQTPNELPNHTRRGGLQTRPSPLTRPTRAILTLSTARHS